MSFPGFTVPSAKLIVTIGVDPGLGGGIATIIGNAAIVNPTPVIVSKVRKRTKNKGMHEVSQKNFDMVAMFDMLKIHFGQDVVFAIEEVGVMGHDSKASMFSFGEGYGYWKMAAVACGFKVVQVRPQVWKKHYPEMLDNDEINSLRDSVKALRAKGALLKDKNDKKRNDEEMAGLNRQIKARAKDAARLTAATLYPELSDSFKLKKDDGKAEALLLARYARATYQ